MKARVRAGDVSVETDGLDLTLRDIRSLLTRCADLAASLPDTPDPDRTRIGFTAPILDKADDPEPRPYESDE